MSECWRIINGTNNNYAVSNYGNVKNLRTGKLLKPSVNHKGYLIFQLSIDNKKKNFRGHRLVAMAFIPNPENLPEVDHKNGNRQYNRDTNLRWVTGSSNTRNREVCRQATSIYNGVHWNKKYKKWSTTIWFERKTKHLGYFDDETDAALDEANSKKYGNMLENLSKYSELIVVTHNRETMSRAQVLYGVTMSGEGSSTLLSIHLEEATGYAK